MKLELAGGTIPVADADAGYVDIWSASDHWYCTPQKFCVVEITGLGPGGWVMDGIAERF